MIRVHSNPDQGPPVIAGTIEHLGTGEKRTFGSGEELLGLLGSWPNRLPKVSPGTVGSSQPLGQGAQDPVD